jgi:hypothetical protein
MVQLTFKEQIDHFGRTGGRLEDPFFSDIAAMSEPIFIPAHVYTFSAQRVNDSDIPTPSELLNPAEAKNYTLTRPYHDTKPIGICLNDAQGAVTILNTKVMPVGAAQIILNVLWQTFNNTIKKSYNEDKFIGNARELYKIPEYAGLFGLNSGPFVLADLLDRSTGGKFNIRYAVNKYQKTDITNPKLIPFDQVPRIAQTKIFTGIQTRALNIDSVVSPFIK